jgi:hypothetical protein
MSRKKDFNFEEMLGMGTVGSAEHAPDTVIQEPVSMSDQSGDGVNIGFYEEDGVRDIIADLLEAHIGLRNGLAKKTTFDFTPEFARALKRWSVDADVSMRDLVVKAVAQVIPVEYLQEYRNTGIQK